MKFTQIPVDINGLGTENVALFLGGVPEWPKGSDCKSDAKASVVQIHPPPPAMFCMYINELQLSLMSG